ncbi:MAG TPA: thiamine phosphate synthase [Gemmatimonadaceae bacterium]|nr:thiamine phosphate synthase [Gemmatimonadaceae bacterium]
MQVRSQFLVPAFSVLCSAFRFPVPGSQFPVSPIPDSRFPIPDESLRLIAITDDLRDGIDGLVRRSAAAVRGGATMVQLRLKDLDPRDLVIAARRLVAALAVPVIVNDRADIALAAGAAGVHVGTDDIPARALRGVVPPGFIIGASVGSDAEVADADGADYVGIGPVFATPSKPDAGAAIGIAEFVRLARRTGLPAVAIGGIDATNFRDALTAGAHGVAVIRAIFAAPDVERAARALSFSIES